MPIQSTPPELPGRAGGVSGRAGARLEGVLSSNVSRVATVKGILVFGKASLFAGRRRNADLGRSVRARGFPPARASAPVTADVRRAPRRGTRSRMRPKRMHPSHARVIVACPGRRVLRSVLRPVHASLVDPNTGGQTFVARHTSRHHGWANPREWEEPALGSNGWAYAARRVSPLPQGRQRGASAKEGGRGLRPCEETRAPVGWSHVVFRCRSQQATSGPE
jgi:hypothetical protein